VSEPRTSAGRDMRRHLFPKITPFVMQKVTEDIIAIEIEAYELGCAATARALAPTPAPLDADDLRTIQQRDDAEDWADRLAYAIAPMDVIGEHSTANSPWQNALDYLDGDYAEFPGMAAAKATLAATPAPLDVPDDDWQERGNPGDDEQGWQPDVVLPEGTFLPRDRRTRHATPAPLDGCEPHVHDDYCALAASFWMHYRCGYVDCRIVEQHEHGDGQAMRQMTPQEIAIAAAYAEETK
jgi:hypothetical protein